MPYKDKLLQLCMGLMSCQSITPQNDGAIEIVERALSAIGYKTTKLVFADTTNLYSRIGTGSPNLCFAGHTDVVPPGEIEKWKVDPFKPQIIDGILYGRGAVDMKAAICAFIIASEQYIKESGNNFNGSISLMITGDEEASGKNGTPKIIQWLQQKDEKIDACIVGEPTSNLKIADTVKIGRRGSITFKLKVIGKQGHVAYPHLAINPVTQLTGILYKLQHYQFDQGNEFFQPSNLEVTTIDVGNKAGNVIPDAAGAQFNIRFNNLYTAEKLEKSIHAIIESITTNYQLEVKTSANPFITEPGLLTEKMIAAIEKVTKSQPEINTNGGTSDARYIKDICPVIELGLLNATAHKIDESTAVDDLYQLSEIYYHFLLLFFN